MKALTFQSDRRYRIAFGITFFGGMALCTGGIIHTTQYGWLHPVSLLGILFGVAALGLGGSVLLQRRIGPVASERTALLALLGIMAIKFILAALYPVIH
jgi:hypothetical protein